MGCVHRLQILKRTTSSGTVNTQGYYSKTVMLLAALLSGQRCQTIYSLSILNMLQTDNKFVFNITKLLKTSKPRKHWGRQKFIAYPEDKRLCVVTCLKQYLKLTEPLRKDSEQLLLSYQKPHKPGSSETIGRWLKSVMNKAGIDTNLFSAHSTRSAATSAAKSLNIYIQTIMDAAVCTNESTFQNFIVNLYNCLGTLVSNLLLQ